MTVGVACSSFGLVLVLVWFVLLEGVCNACEWTPICLVSFCFMG